MSILKEFKEFAMKGNMVDLAVGVIIGGAFNGLISSLVNNVVMPALSILTGKIDFTNMFIAMNGQHYTTLAAAQEETSAIAYGLFITEVINFIIMAFVVFMVVKGINSLRKKPEPVAPTEKVCPFCQSKISIKAGRCPQCTSILDEKLIEEAKKELA
jgi:large conductance mechanosensitive channel